MDKKIAIINTAPEATNLLDCFEELIAKSMQLVFFLKNKNEIRKIQENKWRVFSLPSSVCAEGKTLKFRLAVAVPIALLVAAPLAFYLRKKKIDDIICFNFYEKIYFSFLAPLSGHKTIWIEKPEIEYHRFSFLKKSLFKYFAQKATLVALNSLTVEKIKNLKDALEVKLVRPGVKPNHLQRQENIFEKIAEVEHEKRNKNFFTVGTVNDLKNSKEVEIIFKAVKMVLEVIPSIQIIVIGEGCEKKNLAWLARKMEIENLVWFVGEQKHLKKWLDNFDIYVHSAEKLNLENYRFAVAAQISGLPTIGKEGIGLEDAVINRKSGFLLENFSSEQVADKIIELLKDESLRKRMAENARNYALLNFNTNDSVQKLLEIL